MSSSTNNNQHGLPRHIPNDIALEVRQRSKFGCVICRNAIYQYEHINPEFKYAKKHKVNNICLLCGGCHDKVTRGRISKETVREKYNEVQNNDSIKRPFESLDLTSNNLKINIGSNLFEHTPCLFEIDGERLLTITPNENGTGFPLINGKFYDNNGNEIFKIKDNVWEGPLSLWDIEIQGTRTSIRSVPKKIALEFIINPPNQIHITKIDMIKNNCHIICEGDQIFIGQISSSNNVYIGLKGFQCKGAAAGLSVDSRELSNIRPSGLRMTGGEGIILEGTGIRIGRNAGRMIIGELQLLRN